MSTNVVRYQFNEKPDPDPITDFDFGHQQNLNSSPPTNLTHLEKNTDGRITMALGYYFTGEIALKVGLFGRLIPMCETVEMSPAQFDTYNRLLDTNFRNEALEFLRPFKRRWIRGKVNHIHKIRGPFYFLW